MATAHTPLITREALAELNALRDGPGWLRLFSHLITIVVAGVVWRLETLPRRLRRSPRLGRRLSANDAMASWGEGAAFSGPADVEAGFCTVRSCRQHLRPRTACAQALERGSWHAF